MNRVCRRRCRRLQMSFRRAYPFHQLEIRLQAIQPSPYHAGLPTHRPIHLGTAIGFLACYGPLHLPDPGKPSDPGTYLQSLPASQGIEQSASWRRFIGEEGAVTDARRQPFDELGPRPTPCLASPAQLVANRPGDCFIRQLSLRFPRLRRAHRSPVLSCVG